MCALILLFLYPRPGEVFALVKRSCNGAVVCEAQQGANNVSLVRIDSIKKDVAQRTNRALTTGGHECSSINHVSSTKTTHRLDRKLLIQLAPHIQCFSPMHLREDVKRGDTTAQTVGCDEEENGSKDSPFCLDNCIVRAPKSELRDVTVMFTKLWNSREEWRRSMPPGSFSEVNYVRKSAHNSTAAVIAAKDPLQTCFVLMQQALEMYGGMMRQYIVDDKGCVLISAWGVPSYTHVDDSKRAIQCALKITKSLKAIGVTPYIGITSGVAYCGTVGNTWRSEYAIVGNTVNLAARLMGAAEKQFSHLRRDVEANIKNGTGAQNIKGVSNSGTRRRLRSINNASVKSQMSSVLIDSLTHSRTPLEFKFTTGKQIVVKGRDEPLEIFGVVSDTTVASGLAGRGIIRHHIASAACRFQQHRANLYGEDYKAGVNVSEQHGSGSILLFSGSSGMGKTAVLNALRAKIESSEQVEIDVISVPNSQSISVMRCGRFRHLLRGILEASSVRTALESINSARELLFGKSAVEVCRERNKKSTGREGEDCDFFMAVQAVIADIISTACANEVATGMPMRGSLPAASFKWIEISQNGRSASAIPNDSSYSSEIVSIDELYRTLRFLLQFKWKLSELIPAYNDVQAGSGEGVCRIERRNVSHVEDSGQAKNASFTKCKSMKGGLLLLTSAILRTGFVTRLVRYERAFCILVDDGDRMDSKSWALLLLLCRIHKSHFLMGLTCDEIDQSQVKDLIMLASVLRPPENHYALITGCYESDAHRRTTGLHINSTDESNSEHKYSDISGRNDDVDASLLMMGRTELYGDVVTASLPALTTDAVCDLVAATFGNKCEWPQETIQFLTDISGGIPLVCKELAWALYSEAMKTESRIVVAAGFNEASDQITLNGASSHCTANYCDDTERSMMDAMDAMDLSKMGGASFSFSRHFRPRKPSTLCQEGIQTSVPTPLRVQSDGNKAHGMYKQNQNQLKRRVATVLQRAVLVHLDDCTENERSTLKAASIVGDIFRERTLSEMLNRSVQRVLPSILECLCGEEFLVHYRGFDGSSSSNGEDCFDENDASDDKHEVLMNNGKYPLRLHDDRVASSPITVQRNSNEKEGELSKSRHFAAMVTEQSNELYGFANKMVRSAILSLIAPSEQNKLHRKMAWLTERRYEADLRPHLIFIAYHYGLGNQCEKALGALAKAIHCAALSGCAYDAQQFVYLSVYLITSAYNRSLNDLEQGGNEGMQLALLRAEKSERSAPISLSVPRGEDDHCSEESYGRYTFEKGKVAALEHKLKRLKALRKAVLRSKHAAMKVCERRHEYKGSEFSPARIASKQLSTQGFSLSEESTISSLGAMVNHFNELGLENWVKDASAKYYEIEDIHFFSQTSATLEIKFSRDRTHGAFLQATHRIDIIEEIFSRISTSLFVIWAKYAPENEVTRAAETNLRLGRSNIKEQHGKALIKTRSAASATLPKAPMSHEESAMAALLGKTLRDGRIKKKTRMEVESSYVCIIL